MTGHWLYVDDRRTHEVRVRQAPTDPLVLHVRESALGDRDDGKAWVRSIGLGEPWERQLHLLEIERRLAQVGNYYRAQSDKPGWVAVRRGATRPLDLRPTRGDDETIEFHVYRDEAKDRTRTLVGITRQAPAGPLRVLGRFDVVGRTDEPPAVKILHTALPPPVYHSMLAREALAAMEDHLERVEPRDEKEPWWADVMQLVESLLASVKQGHVKAGEWRPTWRNDRPLSAAQQRARDMGGERAYHVDDEDLGGAKAVEARKGAVSIDEVPNDVFAILNDARLHALQARFLPAGEKERLLKLSERDLRKALRKVRDQAHPDVWHLISCVEASLLVHRALTVRGARIDPETLHVLRHAPAYL